MAGYIFGWNLAAQTSSDHNTITFKVTSEKGGTDNGRNGFVTRGADWKTFEAVVTSRGIDDEWTAAVAPSTLDEEIGAFANAILDAAGETLRTRVQRPQKNPWWTTALTASKREVYKARRAYQLCCVEPWREELQEVYRTKRAYYKLQIGQTKKKAWESFVEREASKNPWGIPYAIVMGECGRPDPMTSLFRGEQHASTIEESTEFFVESTYPRDPPQEDTVEDRTV